jgi:sulfur transfer protein SufE
VHFAADSDSELSHGYCASLVAALNGATPEEVLAVDPGALAAAAAIAFSCLASVSTSPACLISCSSMDSE